MPATTLSSTSKKTPHEASLSPITDSSNQKKLEENQQDIKAMQVHLDRYHVTLEQNTKDVTTLIQKVDVLKFAVHNTIPVDFHVAIDKATTTLCSDFTTTWRILKPLF
jgi:hypothetical protein